MKEMTPMTCAEFEAMVPDLLEGTLSPRELERMDAHRLDCDECDALAADLVDIKTKAANLPTLSASRDLWGGIASRIEAEVVEFPRTPLPGEVAAIVPVPVPAEPLSINRSALSRGPRRAWTMAAAATVLMAATAGITWSVAVRNAPEAATLAESLSTPRVMEGITEARAVSRTSMQAAYDKEIADLRKIVDENKADLDSATAAVLERNLKVIDDAIAECKAALTASPGSAFLLDRLNDAYSTKLRTLRAVAVAPMGGDE
jgi:hypothetical protein